MARTAALPLEERLMQLFQQLGIEQAHVAARDAADWQGLVTAHPAPCVADPRLPPRPRPACAATRGLPPPGGDGR
jgi:hypothetical protein